MPRHYRRRRDDEKERLQGQNLLSAIPIVRALEEILDMNFIRGLCRKDYSHTGQPSVDPIVLFKMMLIGYLFGITSERKLAEECTVNLAFRWYLGYDIDESTPNHSVISKARGRFGKKVFEEFFQEVLSICVEKGLVKGEKIFADGTLIKANASLKSMVARPDAPSPSLSPKEYVEKVFQENPAKSEHKSERKGDNNTPPETNYTDKTVRKPSRNRRRFNLEHMSRTDPEASYVARKGKRMFSYKYHFTIDRKERVITALYAPPGKNCGGSLMIKETDAGTTEREAAHAVYIRSNPFAARIQNTEA